MDYARLEAATSRYRSVLGDDRIEFLLGLWKAQSEAAVELDWEPADVRAMHQAFADGSFMLAAEAPQVDRDLFVEVFGSVAEALKAHPAVDSEALPAVLTADASAIEASDLVDAIVDPLGVVERVGVRLGIDPESDIDRMLLSSLVVFSIQPFAIAVGEKLKDRLPNPELRITHHCPVCGGAPTVGLIADAGEFTGGGRELWCPMCETRWGYPRVRCARCGDAKPQRLHYYYDKEDEGHRIHVCDTCGGSLPVANEKMLGRKAEPRVEELVMLDLHWSVMNDPEVRAGFIDETGESEPAEA